MIDSNVIAYNIASFISALFLLEFGADKFVDHTAIVARLTGVPETAIALLTAGAEWEELIVVVASLSRGRSSLAVGNIVGSAISNILGAFSLGLLFRSSSEPVQFDRSSRIYSLFLIVITTLIAPVVYFSRQKAWLVCGAVLIALFAAYIVSIGWAISRGVLIAPEDSDDESSSNESDTESTSTSSIHETQADRVAGSNPRQQGGNDEEIPLLPPTTARRGGNLGYHVGYLAFGFLAICIAGYVISNASINITDATGISDVLFGMIILSIATTLPEKFIAVLSGNRGHMGILVANTTGSNVFLLTLCVGLVMVDTSGSFNGGNVTISELAVLWSSTMVLTLTVWVRGQFSRWIGGAMVLSYITFIVLEFTIIRNVADVSSTGH